MELYVRNVNEALNSATFMLKNQRNIAVERTTRGSSTLEWPDPVITIYKNPCERVLFSEARDPNPFFHLFESLWMLAGRIDVAFVASMVKHMATFSDDGVAMQGAYGHRWRAVFGFDQIQFVTELLKIDPTSRRAVITMWNPTLDCFGYKGTKGIHAGGIKSKDIPCNDMLFFKVRDGALSMTILCRSNDIIWGAYGANAVHFSILLEYMADKLGLAVGQMYQVSDSWHVYTEGGSSEVWKRIAAASEFSESRDTDPAFDRYSRVPGCEPFPMGVGCEHPVTHFDTDLMTFFGEFDLRTVTVQRPDMYLTLWWQLVAIPMWNAWVKRDASILDQCVATDWAEAGRMWLAKHPKLHLKEGK